MRRRTVMTTMAMMVCVAAAGAMPAAAHPGPEHERKERAELFTQEQRDAIKEMRLEQKKRDLLAKGKLSELKARMQVEMMEAQLNRGEIIELQRQISEAKKQMEIQRMETRLKIMEGMTLEQRAALQKRSDRGKRWKSRWSRGLDELGERKRAAEMRSRRRW